jgi:ketosteroid isomerase-like protein
MAGISTSVVCALILGACTQPPATTAAAPPVDRHAADSAAIHATDSAWLSAVQSKDTAKIVAFYANDGAALDPGAPLVAGKDGLRKAWAVAAADKSFALSWVPLKVVVSGDMAYEIGDYQFAGRGPGGKHMVEKGKYVVVWGRQPDGSWKVLVNAPTTTL